ncbi:MAG: metallophosphoesterase [Micrococcales bacterium]|nr:metallophosphoesterase [Micrococcales bacterium]OJX66812.1 MAG: hypothetical protein BGO94_08230 [Micrococcales bacterium 72-143]
MDRRTDDGRRATRIVHVSDLHLERDGTEHYPGLFARVQRLRGVVSGLAPDLVVATGDLTDRGSSAPDDFALALEWLDALGVPWVAVPGNHDLGSNTARERESPVMERYEDVPFASTGYATAFGGDPVTKARIDGLTVLGIAVREGDPDGAIDRLAREIGEAHGPVVVAGHYPVVSPRTISGSEPFGARGYIDGVVDRLADVLSHPAVIAYLCGHVHLTSMAPIGAGCMQFTAGGLGPGAAALRVYDWDGAEWRYQTVDVDGPQTFWESGLSDARDDPEFSTGSARERAGVWTPPNTITKDPV